MTGGGLDLAAIAARARDKQLPAAVGKELADYIFLPGFSTLAAATQISGRGVGLDAVKTAIEDMRGSVAVTFEPGRFTRFVLDLPLTLTTIRALVVDVGQQRVALDTADVVRLMRASPAQLAVVEGRSVIVLSDGLVLVASLAALLGIEADPQSGARASLPLVIIAAEGRRVALLVDDYVGEQEVLVRPLGRRFARLPHIAGGTFLPGGRMGLILNAHDLVRTAHASAPAPIAAETAQAMTLATRVLLADDFAHHALARAQHPRGCGLCGDRRRRRRGGVAAVAGERRRHRRQRRRDAAHGRVRADRGDPRLQALRGDAGHSRHGAGERRGQAARNAGGRQRLSREERLRREGPARGHRRNCSEAQP